MGDLVWLLIGFSVSVLIGWLVQPFLIRNDVQTWERLFPELPKDRRTYLDLLRFKKWPGD